MMFYLKIESIYIKEKNLIKTLISISRTEPKIVMTNPYIKCMDNLIKRYDMDTLLGFYLYRFYTL